MIKDEHLFSPERDTVENLCLRPTIFQGRAAPPFPLFLEPIRFLAAQAPGIQPTETVIVDCALKDPRIMGDVIDIIGYERRFFRDFEVLRNQIMPKIKGTQFEALDAELMLRLTLVAMNHKKLMLSIDALVSKMNSDSFVRDFIRTFANQPDLIAAHTDYDRRLQTDEQMAIEFSMNFSQKVADVTSGRTIIQLMKSTKVWADFMSKKAFDLAKKLPDDAYMDEKSTLSQFANVTKLFLSSI